MTNKIVKSAVDTGILLEAGTNELEVLIFRINEQRYGVNVAKVRETLEISKVTATPNAAHDAAEGVVRIRDWIVPLVNLEKYLWGQSSKDSQEDDDLLLLLEYNDEMIGFRVNDVERIYRMSWKDVIPMPQVPGSIPPVTSVVLLDGVPVLMLDFETIGARFGMCPDMGSIDREDAASQDNDNDTVPIVFADDSPMIREMLKDELIESGYTNIHSFSDGQSAWEYLLESANNSTVEDIGEKVAFVISDIEMPRMDGLTLTRNIRDHSVLKDLPIILFSSIASKGNENKAYQVGATAQITKPKYRDLTNILSEMRETALVGV